MTFKPNIPQPNDFLDESQVDLLNNFTTLNTNYGVNHYTFSDDSPNAGKHNYVELVKRSLPTTAVGSGSLYTFSPLGSSGETNLAYTPDGGGIGYVLTRVIAASIGVFSTFTVYPQTPPVANQFGGWTFLPGGMLLQYGRVGGSSANTIAVKFPVVFTNPAYSLTITPERAASNPGDSAFTAILTGSLTTTGFTIANVGSHSMDFWYWMAIGV